MKYKPRMRRSKRAHVPFLHRGKLLSVPPWVKVDFTRKPEGYSPAQVFQFSATALSVPTHHFSHQSSVGRDELNL